MEDLRYIYPVARVRVLEKRLLKKEIFLNMLAANTLQEALDILDETANYPSDLLNIKDSETLEAFTKLEIEKLKRLASELFVEPLLFGAYIFLKKDLVRSYNMIMKSKSGFLKDFIRRFIDLHNIKTSLRLRYRKEPIERLNISLIEGGYILRQEFIKPFKEGLGNFYTDVIKEGIAEIEKNENFSLIEKETEDYITDFMRPARYMPFGPEPIFGFSIAKENELKNLRLILLAKINNIQTAQIQQRLTKAYV